MRRHTTFTRLTLNRLDGRNLPSAVISHEVATPLYDTPEPAAYEMRIIDRNETKLESKPVIAVAEFTRPEGPVGPISTKTVRLTKQTIREESQAARAGGDNRIEMPAAAAVQVREQKLVQLALT
ncbi:MAG: hypothetical protein K1X57_00670 [Gemmataceae bacterium]|nr:hypothetical protein [Gemmataceae bacterium]